MVEENDKLLADTKNVLARVTACYVNSQKRLSDKITELNEVRVDMRLELELDKIKPTRRTINSMIEAICKQSEELKGLDDILSLTHYTLYEKQIERIIANEAARNAAREVLEESNKRYQELLDRQKQQSKRLEELEREFGVENQSIIGSLRNSFFTPRAPVKVDIGLSLSNPRN